MLGVALSTGASATLGFFGNFQLVEQLSVQLLSLCLASYGPAPPTSEALKSAEYSLCREYFCPVF